MEPVELDVQRQQQARAYAGLQRKFLVLDLAFGALYVLAWLFSGWSQALTTGLTTRLANDWLIVAGYGLIFGGVYFVLSLPLSYMEGFILPHRFGQSNQSLPGWLSDQLKETLLGAAVGGFVLEVIYAVLRVFPQTWWLWAAGFLLVFSVLMAGLAPTVWMPLFNKFTPLGEEHAELVQRLTRLAERAHTRVQGVYRFDLSRRTKSANAALTGLGRTRRIILGDTLISEFSLDEIETVLAHELGHQVNRDIPIGIAVHSLVTLTGLYLAALGLNWGAEFFGFQGPADIAAFPVFVLVMSLYGLATLPLTNGFSRWREMRADQYALQATHKPQAFISAMTRLANQNLADVNPAGWEEWLLHSHPALSKRIERARNYSSSVSQ